MSENEVIPVIGTIELLRLVKEIKLVENLCERELTNPEGAGFDFRAGEFFKFEEEETGFFGVEKRYTPKVTSIAKYGLTKEITLMPEDYFLVATMEKLNTPYNIKPIIERRSTLQRNGIDLISAAIQPGYVGELTFGLKNQGPIPFTIELGARIAHVSFLRTGENVSSYRGQWQGGRVSTQGKLETQV